MIPPIAQPILSTKQMQMADSYTIKHDGISALTLMEEAGKAVAAASNELKLDGGRVVIIVGPGNNGADGFVAARLLHNKRVAVTVIPLFALDKFKGEAAAQAELAMNAGVKIRPLTSIEDMPKLQSWLNRAVVIVDAIFGTGLTRPLSGWVADAVVCINQSERPILAVDIPSGIHSDTGEVLGGAIKANATLPIAAYKWGHWLRQGKEHSGRVLFPTSIGISTKTLFNAQEKYPITATKSLLISFDMIKQAFPKRHTDAYKQTFGHLWIFGGSIGFTGAPQLSAMGAQAVGVGLASIVCSDAVYPIVAGASLEVMVHPQQSAPWQHAKAIVAGPGWGTEQVKQLDKLLRSKATLILDADALNMISNDSEFQQTMIDRGATTVLTPHPGEAGRLLNISSQNIQQDRLSAALALAEKFNAWIVLKGQQTLVVSPGKHVWLNPFGSAKLAVAGTGDVLTGMIGGLLAANIAPDIAIPAAVGLHGLAGEQPDWYKAGQLEKIIATFIQKFQS